MPNDPKLYREMSEPFATVTEANAALNAFFEELGELRKKHKITNVHCIAAGTMIQGDEETEYMTSMHIGDSNRAQVMTAWSYGRETADHEAMIRRAVADAKKSVESR